MFSMMPDTMVIRILRLNGVQVPVDRGDVIGVTNDKVDNLS